MARRGFTIVELTYVLLLLGVMAAVSIPLLDVGRIRVNGAIQEIATELMAAQRAAVLEGHDIVVAIDQDERFIRVHSDADNDGQLDTGERTKVVHLNEGVAFGRVDAPKLGASTLPVTFTQKQGTLPSLTFHRNGSASELGFLYFTGYGGGAVAKNSRAIEVVRATAKVKCWSYHAGIWQEKC